MLDTTRASFLNFPNLRDLAHDVVASHTSPIAAEEVLKILTDTHDFEFSQRAVSSILVSLCCEKPPRLTRVVLPGKIGSGLGFVVVCPTEGTE